MRAALRGRTAFAVLGAAALCACVSSSAPQKASPSRPPVPPTDEVPAAFYDWHPLILVPFGTLLNEVPLALHEVLLFHDAAQTAAGGEDKDCYALEGASPPKFLGRRPDDYLLCFKHDRLNRIDASVRVPPADAGPLFAAACAHWRGRDAPAPDPQAGDSCEGRDGATSFSAHRGSGDPGQALREWAVPAEAVISISLVGGSP